MSEAPHQPTLDLGMAPATAVDHDLIHPGQFRLSRIQVVNWGTFSNYIDVPVARKGFLITGMSGSGKSTLIDAISSVLVPPGRVDFNAAAQQNAKRGQGRNIVSYIRGAWRRREDSSTGEIATTYLRPRATYTIIGLTYDDAAGTVRTLTALYYLKAGDNSETDVSKYFIIFPQDQDLDQMHGFLKSGIDKRKIKAAFPDAKFNVNHNAFAAAFSRELGISSSEALLLLHRTQSAKSLSSLDSLFREYMLEYPKTFEIAQRAVERFDELRISYEKVQDVRHQIDVLDPLQALVNTRTQATESKKDAQEIKSVLPAVRDKVQAEHLKGAISEITARISTASAIRDQAVQRVEQAQDAFSSARAALQGHDQRISLGKDREHSAADLTNVEREHGRVQAAVEQIEGVMATDAESFEVLRAQAQSVVDGHEKKIEEWNEQRDQAVAERRSVATESDNLKRELDSLSRRSSNIHSDHVRVRDELCAALGLPSKELVFAGELIDIAPSSREWVPVIQRQLGRFATALLVPAELEQQVSEWVNARSLGVNFEFRSVPSTVPDPRPHRDPRALTRKLQVVPHPMTTWVRHELNAKHEYLCVDTVEDFTTVSDRERAVTKEGLVRGAREKDGSKRFIKNDRIPLDDRSRYRLGSSNDEKVELLQVEQKNLGRKLDAATRAVREFDRHISRQNLQNNAAQAILQFTWPQIDPVPLIARIKDIDDRIAAWAASPENAQLQADMERAERDLKQASADQAEAQSAHGGLVSTRRDLAEQLASLTAGITEADIAEGLFAKAESLLRTHTRRITTVSIGQAYDKVARQLDQQISTAQHAIDRANSRITTVLSDYLTRWPNAKAEIQAEPAFAGEAINRLTALRTDGLAQFESRFLELMNGASLQNLSELANQLRRAITDVQTFMERVNHSLAASQFGPERWLRIDARDNRGPIASQFQKDLSHAISGALSSSNNARSAEEHYGRMAVILDKLASSESADARWRNTVLDTRRHVSFVGVEVDSNGDTINTYVDSATLSGGQAQKLVFFCLAAALRYQLADPEEAVSRYGTIVLDEAFDRADPTFTRTAMNVFTDFGFHMVLATPMKLIKTLSPYVDGTITVTYSERANADGAVVAQSGFGLIESIDHG